jgi:hypothetical protein
MGAGQTASTILRRELTRTIEIDDDLHAFILSLATEIGESASTILRRELRLRQDSLHAPGGVVEFHIASGTGATPWNTPETILVATVGQTLRIVNDDAVPHRLHTSGSPFPHPATDILPGQSADALLQTPYDATTQGPLPDHAAGPAAQFWIRVTAA